MSSASYSEDEEVITINLIFCHDKGLKMLMTPHSSLSQYWIHSRIPRFNENMDI